MLNEATSRAISANDRSAGRRKPMTSSTAVRFSRRKASSEIVSVSSPTTPLIERTSVAWFVPAAASTMIRSTAPLPSPRWVPAPAGLNRAAVTPAWESLAPKRAVPTTVTSTGCGVSTVAVVPTARSPLSADVASSTTSSDPVGARPSLMRYGLSAGSAVVPEP